MLFICNAVEVVDCVYVYRAKGAFECLYKFVWSGLHVFFGQYLNIIGLRKKKGFNQGERPQ